MQCNGYPFDVSRGFAILILYEELQGHFFCLHLLEAAPPAIFWRKSEIEKSKGIVVPLAENNMGLVSRN